MLPVEERQARIEQVVAALETLGFTFDELSYTLSDLLASLYTHLGLSVCDDQDSDLMIQHLFQLTDRILDVFDQDDSPHGLVAIHLASLFLVAQTMIDALQEESARAG